MKFRDIFTSKIFIGTIFALIVFNTLVFSAFIEKQKIIIEEKKSVLNLSIKILSTDILWNKDDLNNLKIRAKEFAKTNEKEVNSIKIYDEQGELLVDLENSQKGKTTTSQFGLIMNGETLGYIDIVYNLDNLNKTFFSLFKNIINIEILLILTIICLFILHFRSIHKYLLQISDSLVQLNNGNTDTTLSFELSTLKIIQDSFNRLVTKIKNEKVLQKRNIEDFIHTKDELEAAYNQMISINAVLETTLSNLELSESKYKNIFKYSPFGIALYNISDSKVEDYNEELLRIFENPNEKNLDSIFKNDGIFDIAKSIYDPNETRDEEFYLHSANKIVIISVIPFKVDNKYIQIFFKDITELKNLQTKLQDYAKDLEKEVANQTFYLKEANAKIKNQQQKLVEDAYNKGLIEVTSGIIHNIGNIVNVIGLSLDELISSKESNENILPKFLETVIHKELGEIPDLNSISPNLSKAYDVLPQLFDYNIEFENEIKSKIDFLIKKVYHLKEVVQLQQNFVGSLGTEDYNDINVIIDEVLEIYDSSLIKRNIKVQKKYKNNPKLLCDKAQIIQLISNFLKNSYEAIEEKNINEGLIKICSSVIDDNYVLEIYDNGVGIKKSSLAKLFEFGYSSKKETGSGSGFGLHSCKNIVEKYGGSIDIDTVYELYTKFIVKLPLKKDN